MKIFKKSVVTLGILAAMLIPYGVQTAYGLSLLPYAAPEADCDYILNKFEIENKIPTKGSPAEDAAKSKLEQAEADQRAANRPDNIGACDFDPTSVACTTINNANTAYKEASAAYIIAQEGAKGSPSEKNNLLGCAINTGRMTLAMIPYFISYIINFMLPIIGLICVLFIVIGGYGYIYGGLIEQKEKGKKTIYHALLGMAVASLAWVIVNIILATVTS